MKILTPAQNAESSCLWSAQPQMEHLYHTLPLQGSGTIAEEGAERFLEP